MDRPIAVGVGSDDGSAGQSCNVAYRWSPSTAIETMEVVVPRFTAVPPSPYGCTATYAVPPTAAIARTPVAARAVVVRDRRRRPAA
jgi:hypothetical protein